MAKTVDVVVYELHWPGTTEVYVGSTVQELLGRLACHRRNPCACYSHLDINQADIVPVLTYRTSDRFNRRPEAAHKAQLIKQNCKLLVDPLDNHNQALWLTDEHKAKLSTATKGKKLSEKHRAKVLATRCRGAKHHMYQPFQVTFSDGTVHRWETTIEASLAYGISKSAVLRYLNGKRTPGNRKSSVHLKGTIWQYL